MKKQVKLLTIVIPNRNRDLSTVRRTLSSIVSQRDDGMRIIVVDYGSDVEYQMGLKKLLKEIGDVEVILCQTQEQLWNKARAINIALKKCTTPYFMVADMDMIFHPTFFQKALKGLTPDSIVYFQVGILTKQESKKEIAFNDYSVKFKTNAEATGISLFPTKALLAIQGFDEFYHGWGSEDTDVHLRLQNAGYEIRFYDKECLFLHQWHPKSYRSKVSTAPYCSLLEQINASYLKQTRVLKKVQANRNNSWGVLPIEVVSENYDINVKITNKESEIIAFMQQLEDLPEGLTLKLEVITHSAGNTAKNTLKKVLGKRVFNFLEFDEVNDKILLALVGKLRNAPYSYSYDRKLQAITLHIQIER